VLLLGELYNEEKFYDKGRVALLEVMKLDPKYSSKSWFFLANSYWNLDSFAACYSACDKFLEISKYFERTLPGSTANATQLIIC
jgi:hypothetical protein